VYLTKYIEKEFINLGIVVSPPSVVFLRNGLYVYLVRDIAYLLGLEKNRDFYLLYMQRIHSEAEAKLQERIKRR
jgi:hypothetical protein